MKLSKLLKPITHVCKDADFEVVNVTSDIDEVTRNSVFIPIKGVSFDSHIYIDEALKRGAYVVRETNNNQISGILKQRFIGNPCESMICIGVIGTNGKSSVVHYLRNFLKDYKVGTIVNASFMINDEILMKLNNTTPSSEELMKIMQLCKEEYCEYFIMEISSHSIKQERIAGLSFDTLIYTNISQDHLDYHDSIMEYTSTKIMGVSYLKKNGFILCNDDNLRKMLERNYKRVINIKEKYSYNSYLDSYRRILTINNKHIELKVLSEFDVENIMFAYAYMCENDFNTMDIYDYMINMKGLEGRMELIYHDSFNIVIDYAHTYMAYYELCKYVSNINEQKILVFGLGGNRDEYKRSMIGKLVNKYFDYVIVTSDNIRNENPEKICGEIAADMNNNYIIIINREEAIRKAISIIENNGIIIIAGKGNEEFQIVGNKKIPFKDKDIVYKILNEEEV